MHVPAPAVIRDYAVAANRQIAEGVFELALVPADPANRVPSPNAGQWVMLNILEPDGSVWGKSPYSITNAPSEVAGSGRVTLAIREAGAFTRRAKTLRAGEAVKLQGPFGVFTLAEGAERQAFFAGGIGISPLRCMILQSLSAHPETPITLFASSKTAREAAFLSEFRALAETNPRVSFVPVFTRETDNDVKGERGRINEALIRRHLGPPESVHCYVCGPRPFMDEVTKLLGDIGVEKERIHFERFG
jgi:glycine betaine catabolism B